MVPIVRVERRSIKKNQSTLLQDLANMPDSGFRDFQRKWGRQFDYSLKALLQRRDELRLLWQVEAGANIVLTNRTKRLRDQIWRELGQPAEFTWICNHWLRLERQV